MSQKEKKCKRCGNLLPVSAFLDIYGRQNSRGKFCKKCHISRHIEFLTSGINKELSHISDLYTKFGNEWINNCSPYSLMNLLIYESDACPYCGKEFEYDSFNRRIFTFDHMNPQELGGDDSVSNIIVVCKSCNSTKRAKPFLKWLDLIEPARRNLLYSIYCQRHGYSPNEYIETSRDISVEIKAEITPAGVKFDISDSNKKTPITIKNREMVKYFEKLGSDIIQKKSNELKSNIIASLDIYNSL